MTKSTRQTSLKSVQPGIERVIIRDHINYIAIRKKTMIRPQYSCVIFGLLANIATAEIVYSLEYSGPHQTPVGTEIVVLVRASFDAPLAATRFTLISEGEGMSSIRGRSANPVESNGLTYLSPHSQEPFENDLPHFFTDGSKTEVLYDADYDDEPGGLTDGIGPAKNIILESLIIRADAPGVVRLSLDNVSAVRTDLDPQGTFFDSEIDASAGSVVFAVGNSTLTSDYDADGDVDLIDFAELSECVSGPNITGISPGCSFFDREEDSDIDLLDFGAFQTDFAPTTKNGSP